MPGYSYTWTGSGNGSSLTDPQNWTGGPVDPSNPTIQLTTPGHDPNDTIAFASSVANVTGSVTLASAGVQNGATVTLSGSIAATTGLGITQGSYLSLLSGSSFTTPGYENDAGSINQSGGVNSAGLGLGANNYTITGGSLTVNGSYLNVSGVFQETNAAATVTAWALNLTSGGAIDLTAGSFKADSSYGFVYTANTDSITQTGGTASFGSGLVLGYNDATGTQADYRYEGGALTTGDVYVGDGGYGNFVISPMSGAGNVTTGSVFVGFVNQATGLGSTAHGYLTIDGTAGAAKLTAKFMSLAAFDNGYNSTTSWGQVTMKGASTLNLTGTDSSGNALIIGENGNGTFYQQDSSKVSFSGFMVVGEMGAGTASAYFLGGTSALQMTAGTIIKLGVDAGASGSFYFNADGPNLDNAQFNPTSAQDVTLDVGMGGTGKLEIDGNQLSASFVNIGGTGTAVSTTLVDSHSVAGAHRAQLTTLGILVGEYTDHSAAGDGKLIDQNGADVSAATSIQMASQVTGFGAQATANGGILVTGGSSMEIGGAPGAAAANTLEVFSGGTLSGHGLIDSTKTGTGANGLPTWSLNVQVDAGGTLSVDADSMVIHGNLIEQGYVGLAAGATLEVDGTISSGAQFNFLGANATLRVAQNNGFLAAGFGRAANQQIDFLALAYNANDVVVTTNVPNLGEIVEILSPDESKLLASFQIAGAFNALPGISSDGQGGTLVSFGSLISTNLRPGNTLISNISGQAYSAFEQNYSNSILTGDSYFYQNIGNMPFKAYATDFTAANVFIGANYFYMPASGAYAAEKVSTDAVGRLKAISFSGATTGPFSCADYCYTGGVFSGSSYRLLALPQVANLTGEELRFNGANALTAVAFDFTNLTGFRYTSLTETVNGAGALSGLDFNGFTGAGYNRLAQSFNAGTFTGYTTYYTPSSAPFYSEQLTYNASNQITQAGYYGYSSAPYYSLVQNYANGVVATSTFDFINIGGASYHSYALTQDANGLNLQATYNNNDGTNTLIGFGTSGLAFNSLGNDTFVGGAGGETFNLGPAYGSEIFTDFYKYATGASHDTISLSLGEFSNFSAVLGAASDVSGNVVVKGANGDMFTIQGMTKATLTGLGGDFTFHN